MAVWALGNYSEILFFSQIQKNNLKLFIFYKPIIFHKMGCQKMKKRNKRLLAVAMSAAMSCSMVTGWANTAEIVSVLKNDVVVDLTTSSLEVTPNDVVKVNVKINDTSSAAIEGAEATFLSYVNTAVTTVEGVDTITLDNTTIQYVDQQTTAVPEGSEEGTAAYATFTFRPRMNAAGTGLLLSGAHTAKVGGTSVDSPTPFTYTVAAAKIDMTVTGNTTAYTQGNTSDTAFTLNLASDVTPSKVMLGSVELTDSDYTYASGTLTILKTYLDTLTVTENTSYNLVVSASGYNDGTLASAITINAVVEDDVKEEEKDAVVEDLKDVTIPTNVTVDTENNKASIALNSGTTTGEYEVKYAINKQTGGVSIENNAIVLDTSVKPFAKVEVKVYAGTGETAYDVKTVYIVPEPEKVGFGNIGLHTDGASDPFVYVDAEDVDEDEAFKTYVNDTIGSTVKLEQRAIARNIVLGKGSKNDLPHFEGALDYNQDGNLALAEYRIYKLMMDGNDENHTFSKVNAARAEWVAKANEEATQQ